MKDRMITTQIDGSPAGYDLVFTSIDVNGNPGELNRFVLIESGYSIKDIPKSLSHGFAILKRKGLPTVVFIVTIDPSKGSSDVVLGENLRLFFLNFSESLTNRKAWMPLLGTGAAGLSSRESCKVIGKIVAEIEFKFHSLTISFPKGTSISDRNKMQSQLKKDFQKLVVKYDLDENDLDEKLESVSFFVAGHKWGSIDKLPIFITENRWENGHEDSVTAAVNSVKIGDILFAKTTWVKAKSQGILNLRAVGVVFGNNNDGHNLSVRWHRFDQPIDLSVGSHYRYTFQLIQEKYIKEIVRGVLNEVINLFEIISNLQTNKRYEIENDRLERLIEKAQTCWWLVDNKREWFGVEGNTFSLQLPAFPGFLPSLNDLILLYNSSSRTLEGLFKVDKKIRSSTVSISLVQNLSRKFKEEDLESLLPLSELQNHEISRTTFREIVNSSNSFDSGQFVSNPLSQTDISNDVAYSSEDLLDIENDVRSFALLLASNRVKPPLAIALFGNWGSGKSFFMRYLQSKVDELSTHQGFLFKKHEEGKPVDGQDQFCRGIAQIEFNAWSYLDSNLWAGLASSIFEKLNEYITDSTKSGIARLQVQEKLKEKIKYLQNQKATAKSRKSELKKLKQEYEEEKKNLEMSLESEFRQKILRRIGSEKLSGLYEDISEDPHLARLSQELNLDKLKRDANTFRVFWRNVRNGRKLLPFFIAAFSSLLLMASMLCLFNEWYVYFSGIVPLGLYFNRVGKYYRVVEKFIQQYNSALAGSSDILVEVEKYKAEVKIVEEQMDEADEEISRLENDLKENEEININDEAIKHFISERTNHKDYKDKLGIVSIIRKDFETLSGLFYDQSEANESSLNKHFKQGRNLERIILYIDDLDRCSDAKVLEVIQAVHLLLAFPLFNVVVGVDKRCVRNALYLKTNLEYRKITTLDEIMKIGVEMVTPDEYLEKIFQIPFELKVPEKKSMERLVDSMLNVASDVQQDGLELDIEPSRLEELEEEIGIRFQRTDLLENSSEENNESQNSNDPRELLVSSAPENLELSQLEATRIKEMLSLVGNTPRTIKQYINIYRIIRSHEVIKYDSSKKEDVFLFIMLMLALTMGKYRKYSSHFLSIIKAETNQDQKVDSMLNKLGDDGISIVSNLKELVNCKSILHNKVLDFDSDIIDFVGRFSFAKKEELLTESTTT